MKVAIRHLFFLFALLPVIGVAAIKVGKDDIVPPLGTLSVEYTQSQFIEDAIGSNPFVIDASKVKYIREILGLDNETLLRYLVPIAKLLARSPISGYKVGIAGLGKSGNIYLGVNLEFPGFPLNATVHGEQFLLSNVRNHGETELLAIALSAAPCGHCRQFLSEIGGDRDLKILFQKPKAEGETVDISTELSFLLPESFGPQDLGFKGGLLTPAEFSKSDHADPLTARAIDAARSSYAPYSESLSGVAIRTKDGNVYSGSYLENAAFNPGLSPFQSALIALVVDMRQYDEISEVVLAEYPSAKVSQAAITEGILKSIAPEAKFRVHKLKKFI